MMHERNQRMVARKRRRNIRKNAESESIDDNRAARRNSRELPSRVFPLLTIRIRKTFTEVDHIDCPAEPLELADDAAVIDITARWSRKIARHRERNPSHHKGASYQARATCDSESVTRIALRSRPSRPSLPPRAASAKPS